MLGFCAIARLFKGFYNCMLKSNQPQHGRGKGTQNPTPDQRATGNRWKWERQFL